MCSYEVVREVMDAIFTDDSGETWRIYEKGPASPLTAHILERLWIGQNVRRYSDVVDTKGNGIDEYGAAIVKILPYEAGNAKYGSFLESLIAKSTDREDIARIFAAMMIPKTKEGEALYYYNFEDDDHTTVLFPQLDIKIRLAEDEGSECIRSVLDYFYSIHPSDWKATDAINPEEFLLSPVLLLQSNMGAFLNDDNILVFAKTLFDLLKDDKNRLEKYFIRADTEKDRILSHFDSFMQKISSHPFHDNQLPTGKPIRGYDRKVHGDLEETFNDDAEVVLCWFMGFITYDPEARKYDISRFRKPSEEVEFFFEELGHQHDLMNEHIRMLWRNITQDIQNRKISYKHSWNGALNKVQMGLSNFFRLLLIISGLHADSEFMESMPRTLVAHLFEEGDEDIRRLLIEKEEFRTELLDEFEAAFERTVQRITPGHGTVSIKTVRLCIGEGEGTCEIFGDVYITTKFKNGHNFSASMFHKPASDTNASTVSIDYGKFFEEDGKVFEIFGTDTEMEKCTERGRDVFHCLIRNYVRAASHYNTFLTQSDSVREKYCDPHGTLMRSRISSDADRISFLKVLQSFLDSYEWNRHDISEKITKIMINVLANCNLEDPSTVASLAFYLSSNPNLVKKFLSPLERDDLQNAACNAQDE